MIILNGRGGAIDNKREMLLNHIEYVFAPTDR
jgi:hypothetical protein